MKSSNKLSRTLKEFSLYRTIKDCNFKPHTYEPASKSVAGLDKTNKVYSED